MGTIGDFGSFSFERSELMTAGEGGALIADHHRWGRYAYSLAYAGTTYGNQPGRYDEGASPDGTPA